jgi:hypothetical protein
MMSDTAVRPAAGYAENSARLRVAHYREEADRFRSMAELEPVAVLRRHLATLVRQYEQLAANPGSKAKY